MAVTGLQKLPTVEPGQLPAKPDISPKLIAAASGEMLGETIRQTASVVANVAREAKERADVARVQEAETEFEKRRIDKLYGANGILTKQGHDALSGSRDAYEAIGKDREEIAGNLTDEQREIFIRRTDSNILQSRQQIEMHNAKQRDAVETQAYESRRYESLNVIANGYDNPALIAEERKKFEDYVMLEARRRGLEGAGTYPPPPDSPAGTLLNLWHKDVTRTVLDRLLAEKNTDKAQAFLAAPITEGGPTAAEVLGADADKYVQSIQHIKEQVDAFAYAEAAVEKARSPKNSRVDEIAARRFISTVPPTLRREARANLESLLNAEDESWRRQVNDVWNRAKTAYLGGPDGRGRRGIGAIDGKTASWLRDNEPDAWRKLMDWAENDIRDDRGLPSTPAQDSRFSAIVTDMIDHPEKYVQMDGPEFEQRFMSQVGRRDRRALLGHLLQLKGQAHKPDETLPAYVMREVIEKGRSVGAFPRKGAPETWGPRAAAHALMVRELLDYQTEKKTAGEKITPQQWTEEINKRLQKVEIEKPYWFNPKVTELEARALPEYQAYPYSPVRTGQEVKVDEATKQRTIKILQQYGYPTTDEFVNWWIRDGQGVPVSENPKPQNTELPTPVVKPSEGLGE